jgi:hypothetical protein
MDKVKLVEEARNVAENYLMPPDLPREAGCLYYACGTLIALNRAGYSLNKLRLMAGTAMFPRIRRDQDDGKMNTHFSYMFDATGPTGLCRLPAMPEMHVWVATTRDYDFIDLTTKFLPVQCVKRTGERWIGNPPPDFLWCKWEHLPVDYPDYVYSPDRDAIKVAQMLAKNVLTVFKKKELLKK